MSKESEEGDNNRRVRKWTPEEVRSQILQIILVIVSIHP
jgi:hypothetical protein